MFENLPPLINLTFSAILIGSGATAIMDIWALLLKRAFKIASLDYAMVGRWIGYMFEGKFMHQGIGRSNAIAGEKIIGWTAHYLIGVIFAAALLLICGTSWVETPNLAPALIIGVVTVAFPFLIMQPCFGIGIAANKLPNPHIAQFKSIVTHSIFGVGLYLAAQISSLF